MTPRTRSQIGVLIMSAMLVLYFAFAGLRGIALLASGTPVAVAMGAAMLVLPLIGAWALLRELRFGRDATRLADRLDELGQLPDDAVETLPSGRPTRDAADAVFPKYRAEVEAAPKSWAAWMRLGMVYDAAGDRKRAREAVRKAIGLERDGIRR
ncbi:tetratricopeptide repeat protein [Leucobacter sp. gxy201]|uniref:tetratricopeptide repeat protein n=1 Tax=Leucobacter sp. gxy201 TaxID=2957200 RepID=UPI003DA1C867